MRKILCLDGGGARGILPASILHRLSEDIGKPLQEMFDMVVGTSTGGLIAASIGSGMTSKEIEDVYMSETARVFAHPKGFFRRLFRAKHDLTGLENVLFEQFGEMRLGESKVPIMLTTYDVDRRMASFWKSWEFSDGTEEMVQVAMATAAAPTYFPAVELRGTYHVDGGVHSVNPCLSGFAEALKMWPGEEITVISLGTGNRDFPEKSPKLYDGGLLDWAAEIGGIMLDGMGDVNAYIMKQIARHSEHSFFRYDVLLPTNIPMDASGFATNMVLRELAMQDYDDGRLDDVLALFA